MNAASTPVRERSAKCCTEHFVGVTPIKSVDATDPKVYEFDDFFDNFLVNDDSRFGDGKRKWRPGNHKESSRLKILSPCSSPMNKKHKINDGKPILSDNRYVKVNEADNKNGYVENVTFGVDMFEEDYFVNSSPKSETNVYHITSQKSKDVVENSPLTNVNGMFDNELPNLSILEKLENAASVGDNCEPQCSNRKSKDEGSCGLNISVPENAVVNTILNAMDLETVVGQNAHEVHKKDNFPQTGFSQILMETVANWEEEQNITIKVNETNYDDNGKLTDKVKKKLLNNANIEKTDPKTDATGWSQMSGFSNIFEDFILQGSEYQELGPFFGLPAKVQDLYREHKGISNLYDWQKECLTLKAVREKKNLVYSLPTSGGKTLVAEILILRELLCYNKNVLFILPFVSIVQEKVHDLSLLALNLGFFVEEYAAGKGVIPLKNRRRKKSVIVATIEKASSVIISLIETKKLDDFGLIVVDELHLVSEESGRGAILESLLTHVLYLGEKIQIIGMTATIGNLNEIATFLKAESYISTFRPVELQEYVKCGQDIFAINWGVEETLEPIRSIQATSKVSDPDGISNLVLEVIPKDSVLIFCPTKRNCENVAVLLKDMMPKHIREYKQKEKFSFYKALQSETNGQIDDVLSRTIPYGIVYHHSGVTPGERKLFEEAFRAGTISVICCTSTLAAGVNLPAARVILRSPYVGKDFISLSKYKQMAGRAGRAGMGRKGESYLICQPMDSKKVKDLLESKMEDSISKMNEDNLKSLILSAIGLGIGTTRGELRKLIRCTLLSVQAERLNANVKELIDSCISSLFKMGAIKVKDCEYKESDGNISGINIKITNSDNKNISITSNSQLSVSRLGTAAIKGCLGVERAHELYGDLTRAQSGLVLLSDLHLLYLVTPYEVVDQIKPNCSAYFNVYMHLGAKDLTAAKMIGVTEFVMTKVAVDSMPKCISKKVLNRFYASLMMHEVIKQQSIWEVANVFQISPGTIQNLITSTATFANNVLRFCEELKELWCFRSLLSEFAPRLTHCCASELIPLLELPAVKRGRAKQLYDAGFKDLNIIANADVNEMVKLVDHLPKRVASQIVAAARLLLVKKAESLKEEAEEVLQGLSEKIIGEWIL